LKEGFVKSYKTEQIRNVGLFAHGGAGKTSLAEALLFNTGAINRLGRVEDGTSVSDYDEEEKKRRISVNLSLIPCEWKDHKFNIVDTPGYADFVGEVVEGFRVVDAAVIVLCAVNGLEVGTEQAWRLADNRTMPRMAVISRIDRENADFDRVVGHMRDKFGPSVVPIQLPIGSQDKFLGVVDLIAMKALVGAKGEEGPIPSGLLDAAKAAHEKVVEAAAESDDVLIEKYLGGEELSTAEVIAGLRKAILGGKVCPVLVCTATGNKGVVPILDAIASYLPSPLEAAPIVGVNPVTNAEVSLKPSDMESLSALVFKTSADPFVGKLTYFRVYSGIIHSDTRAFNPGRNAEERLGQLYLIRGKTQEPTVQFGAGDMGAVAKLAETVTGDTLCARDHPVILPPIVFPEPAFTAAVHPKTKADLDKMGSALKRLAEEDPTIIVHRDPDTAETLVSAMGESHVDIAMERLRRKFGAEVTISLPKVALKETITAKVQAHHRHKKQSGGHGQFGEVYLELEPLPRGSGVEFVEKVVGGSVPKNFIPAVEKGVRERVTEGVLAGFPVVDIRVSLYDGKYHEVDSSEMSFHIAGSQAVKNGVEDPAARATLLEPVMLLTVSVPDAYTGDIMGDLTSKRGRVLGIEPGNGLSIISAHVPLSEMQRYGTDLRSMTQGRGTFRSAFDHFEDVPAHLAQGIIEAARKEREEKE
jgi:elongation factor G